MDHYAAAVCKTASGAAPIDWRGVDPESLPETSLIRAVLERGRPEIAAFLAAEFPDGCEAYIHTEATHRRAILTPEARGAVASGAMSAREASRVYGVDRARL